MLVPMEFLQNWTIETILGEDEALAIKYCDIAPIYFLILLVFIVECVKREERNVAHRPICGRRTLVHSTDS